MPKPSRIHKAIRSLVRKHEGQKRRRLMAAMNEYETGKVWNSERINRLGNEITRLSRELQGPLKWNSSLDEIPWAKFAKRVLASKKVRARAQRIQWLRRHLKPFLPRLRDLNHRFQMQVSDRPMVITLKSIALHKAALLKLQKERLLIHRDLIVVYENFLNKFPNLRKTSQVTYRSILNKLLDLSERMAQDLDASASESPDDRMADELRAYARAERVHCARYKELLEKLR